MKLSEYQSNYSKRATRMNAYTAFDLNKKQNKDETKKWLQKILQSNEVFHTRIVDVTEYEKLIFISQIYKDCEEIQQLVSKIFYLISVKYVERKKYIDKIQVND